MEPLAPFDIDSPHRAALDAVMDGLRACEHEMRSLEARRQQLAAEAQELAAAEAERFPADSRGTAMPYRAEAVEAGNALDVSDRAAARMLEHAAVLTADYPKVHEALSEGRVAGGHAQAIVHHGVIIDDPAARAGYTAEVLDIAVTESVGRTWYLAKALAEKHADQDVAARQADAFAHRGMQVVGLDDGVAELRLVTDASYVYGIEDRVRRQARVVQDAERAALKAWEEANGRRDNADSAGGDSGAGAAPDADNTSAGAEVDAGEVPVVRPLRQIRADLATDLLLNGAPSNAHADVDLAGVQARIQVTVPVLTLLTDTDTDTDTDPDPDPDPDTDAAGHRYLRVAGLQGAATLAGYGPIHAGAARLLAGLQAGWDRISCHPVTGQVITVDRYRPSEEIKRFVLARDQHCRAPGCVAAPHQGDLDHAIEAACGGETSTRNISALCRRHHVNKHHAGIRMRLHEDGTIEWTTPLGNTIRDHPTSRVMFRPRTRVSREDSARVPGEKTVRHPGNPRGSGNPRGPEGAGSTGRQRGDSGVRFTPADPPEPAGRPARHPRKSGRPRQTTPTPSEHSLGAVQVERLGDPRRLSVEYVYTSKSATARCSFTGPETASTFWCSGCRL